MIDVIIVSFAEDIRLQKMTQEAIDTCRLDEVNVIVVEQNNKVHYDNAKTLHYEFKFNYHRCMNYGLTHCKNEYVALCNNDLIFQKDWAKNLIRILEQGFDTVCPYCPRTHPSRDKKKGNYYYEGFAVGFEFIGWCIVGRTSLFKEIKLNEVIEFWYSDNFTAKQLQFHGKRHALVCNSFVEHINSGSRTLIRMKKSEKDKLTSKQKRIYEKELRRLYAKGKGN